jgi:hypothetical protein
MGMHLIKTEKASRRRTTIGVDNQAAISAVQNELSTPTHILAKDILHTATQLKKIRGNKNYALTLRWMAGHVGIDGNELVDSEAKHAAKGQSSDPNLLPRILRRKLKISTSALKQNRSMKSISNWKKNWTKSARGKQDHKIDPSSPSKKFIELISNPKLSRKASSFISQFRIAHIPLNSYLHRFKRVDQPSCPACGDPKETVEHFLLHCPAYAHERWVLEKAIKSKPSLKILLGNSKTAQALGNYIEATHRFNYAKLSTKSGESTNP